MTFETILVWAVLIVLGIGAFLRGRVPFSSIVALAITGWLSAWIGGSPRLRAILRVTIGGALALSVTWAIGALLGVAV